MNAKHRGVLTRLVPLMPWLLMLCTASAPVRADGGGILQATLAESGPKTPEVSTEQVRRVVQDGTALIIDTRSAAEFASGHIPGARAVGGPEAVAAVEKIVSGNKAQPLVLYCNGPYCQASRRLGDQLVDAGFSNVTRYQLGIPVWRALGGPTEIELEAIARVHARDRTAVFIDARPAEDFARGSLPGARSAPPGPSAGAALKAPLLPEDDFNTRIVIFGRNAADARALAELMRTRPWHNVAYYPGSFESLRAAIP